MRKRLHRSVAAVTELNGKQWRPLAKLPVGTPQIPIQNTLLVLNGEQYLSQVRSRNFVSVS
jgi:hypothetical protein